MSTKLNFRTRPVPDKFNPNARYSGQLEGVKTLGTEITIKEAIEKNFIANQKEDLVASTVTGVLKSMIAGVQSDGNARAIDGVISFTPYMTGGFAGKKSAFDPKKNSIVVRARLMKELKINNSVFSLTNATDGIIVKLSGICTVSTDDGAVKIGEDIELVGDNLKLGVDGLVTYRYGETSGEAEVIRNTANGITIKWPEAITDQLEDAKLVIIVRTRGGDTEGDPQEVDIEADVLESDQPTTPKITSVVSTGTGGTGEWKVFRDELTAKVANAADEDAKLNLELVDKATGAIKARLPWTDGNTVTRVDESTFKLVIATNTSEYPDIAWSNSSTYEVYLTLETNSGHDAMRLTPVTTQG